MRIALTLPVSQRSRFIKWIPPRYKTKLKFPGCLTGRSAQWSLYTHQPLSFIRDDLKINLYLLPHPYLLLLHSFAFPTLASKRSFSHSTVFVWQTKQAIGRFTLLFGLTLQTLLNYFILLSSECFCINNNLFECNVLNLRNYLTFSTIWFFGLVNFHLELWSIETSENKSWPHKSK